MKKEYFANLDYNRHKRRKVLTLSIIGFIMFSGTASVFIAFKTYSIAIMFLLGLIIPITAIPSAFKNYPVNGLPVVTFENDSVVFRNKTLAIKEISSIKITIEIPAYEVNKLDYDVVEEYQNKKPEDEYFGTFDVFYKNEKNQTRVVYNNIDGVIGALETAISLGVKRYAIFYVVKGNSIKSNYDMISLVKHKKQDEFNKTSKQTKTRQLI